ncbi:epoxyqueuosine reductase QueH [Treponema brennaborense]|uniref:Epoxyqueuosine reductase QueH n=1 Tax=Treponema brennaborense (strain DSM 12168 / CIP 105900 / DD5/3) TaxID=906968 RepID=F4LP08_TREBD|nr:epoxyqueuosine reductase QueH [Treponema brennaborense]AEE17985.1 protein of unknown function DUF208 [Treponema brennaborense DSM 12168]
MNKTDTNGRTEKPNYQKQLEAELDHIRRSAAAAAATFEVKKPSLLLHACCAPCSSYVIEYLHSIFDITVFYYNPNIHPQAEYARRMTELSSFIKRFPCAQQVQLCVPPYDPDEYFSATNVRSEPELETEAERGERCRRCYRLRMERAFSYAAAAGFDYVTTTLSISPYKDAEKINAIGRELENEFRTAAAVTDKAINAAQQPSDRSPHDDVHIATGTYVATGTPPPRYLYADFKKKNGFKRSLELSAEYGLYRQDYCGCVYSRQNGTHSPSE